MQRDAVVSELDEDTACVIEDSQSAPSATLNDVPPHSEGYLDENQQA